jgi:hypothetical protein
MQEEFIPFTLSTINLDNIIYKKVKKISSNTKLVFIKYNDNNQLQNFVFQIPTIINNGVINNDELSFNLKCVNIDKTNTLIKFFNNLDNKIIEDSKNNNWFTDNLLYKKFINYNNNINIKIVNNDTFNTKLFLNETERITFDQIPNIAETNPHKLGTCKIILDCYAVWIKKNSFSILFRPVSISFSKFNESIYNYKFIHDSDDSNDNIISDYDTDEQRENNIILTEVLDEYTTSTSSNKY